MVFAPQALNERPLRDFETELHPTRMLEIRVAFALLARDDDNLLN